MRFKKIRELRVINELTQKEMAEILNISPQALSAYEKGNRAIPIDILLRFADHFGVSVDYILEHKVKRKDN